MSPLTHRVAARIVTLRERRGLTQEQLAGKARINRVTLARLERAMHQPTLDTLDQIARALRVGLIKLLT